MGKLLLAGAIEGLGAGLGKAAEQRGKMAQEAERTARDIALQRMRDKAAMDRQSESDVSTAEREEARYGPEGFEAAAAEVKHGYALEEIEARGAADLKTAKERAAATNTSIPTIKRAIVDADGFPLGDEEIPIWRDPETHVTYEQHPRTGKLVPLNVHGNLDVGEKRLYDNPHLWRNWQREVGALPQWFEDHFSEYKKKGKEPPSRTPGPRGGGIVAARGQVQREGAGGGGGTEPAPDLQQRLFERARELP